MRKFTLSFGLIFQLFLVVIVHSQENFGPLPDGVSIEHDLSFLAEGREEKLDLYQPTDRDKKTLSPAIVIIHGGGWVKGDKNRKREFITGTTLAKSGYVCASINYETRKEHRWPNNLHDCKNAVRWFRVHAEELQIDPERIGVIGGSAGGHLALMVAYTADHPKLSPRQPYPGISDKVNACVNMYGISNLLTRCLTDEDGMPTDELKTHRLFSESRTEAPEKWRLASPVTHITKKSPPTLSLHGTKDHVVDRGQSNELHQELKKVGVENKLIPIKGARHAWPLRTEKFDYTKEVTNFFNRHLKHTPAQ